MKADLKKYCVLGHGISYTLSPRVHAAILSYLGERGEYFAEDVAPQELNKTVERLLCECDGFNVTKPYKESVAALLGHDGPVNTVRRDGKCTSTDPIGFLSDYTEKFGEPHGKILLLGAGGAAKSVAQALCGKAELYVYNRTLKHAAAMEKFGATVIRDCRGGFDAVVNCTVLGLNGEQSAPDELDLGKVKYAYDLIYSPEDTPFLNKARCAGASACNGIGMLIRQAIAAHGFWRGEKFDADTENKMAAHVAEEIDK